jgi:hypothetical protein
MPCVSVGAGSAALVLSTGIDAVLEGCRQASRLHVRTAIFLALRTAGSPPLTGIQKL